MYSQRSYLHLLVHDVGCRCTLNGATFPCLQQKYEPRCTPIRVTFTYLPQKYKPPILDNVVRAPSIVANGLLEYPQTKGDPFSKMYGEHFGSKADVISTEVPSHIGDNTAGHAWQPHEYSLKNAQTMGKPFSKTHDKQFGSNAGVLLTELPSLIFVRFKSSMTTDVSIGSTTLNNAQTSVSGPF